MDTEIRLTKVEVEVDTLKELVDRNTMVLAECKETIAENRQAIAENRQAIAENRQALADLRETMDRRFAEQQAQINRLETRIDQGFAEMRSNFKWLMGTMLTMFFFLLGLIGKAAGLY